MIHTLPPGSPVNRSLIEDTRTVCSTGAFPWAGLAPSPAERLVAMPSTRCRGQQCPWVPTPSLQASACALSLLAQWWEVLSASCSLFPGLTRHLLWTETRAQTTFHADGDPGVSPRGSLVQDQMQLPPAPWQSPCTACGNSRLKWRHSLSTRCAIHPPQWPFISPPLLPLWSVSLPSGEHGRLPSSGLRGLLGEEFMFSASFWCLVTIQSIYSHLHASCMENYFMLSNRLFSCSVFRCFCPWPWKLFGNGHRQCVQ